MPGAPSELTQPLPCLTCGYDLSGLNRRTERCPECGTPIPSNIRDIQQARRTARAPIVSDIWLWIILMIFALPFATFAYGGPTVLLSSIVAFFVGSGIALVIHLGLPRGQFRYAARAWLEKSPLLLVTPLATILAQLLSLLLALPVAFALAIALTLVWARSIDRTYNQLGVSVGVTRFLALILIVLLVDLTPFAAALTVLMIDLNSV